MSGFGAGEDNLSFLYDLVVNALVDNWLFSSIDFEQCREATSLGSLLQMEPMQQLQQMFIEAGLPPSVGFNPGSGEISFSLTLPMFRKPGSQAAAVDLEPIVLVEKQQVAVWLMLGLVPEQLTLEQLFQGSDLLEVALPTHYREPKQTQTDLLANKLLNVFSTQTGVAIIERRVDFGLGRLRLTFCPQVETRYGPRRKPFRFSPSYNLLSGFDPVASTYSQAKLVEQQEALLDSIIQDFWQRMERKRYIADATLASEISSSLRTYLHGGVCAQSAGFLAECKPLSLYLHGRPGIGKTAFVHTFSSVLEELLRKHIDPSKTVTIVKLPLNSITPTNLRKILHVRGISDMSIERVLEQTICKGNIAVFHLEENPEDPAIQLQLFNAIGMMLEILYRRYPEYSANVISIYTSNYLPVDDIEKASKLLHLEPPSAAKQREWCASMLQDCISQRTEIHPTKVQIDSELPQTQDMRPLEQWWKTVGFYASDQLLKWLASNTKPSGVTVTISGVAPNLQLSFSVANQGSVIDPVKLFSQDSFFYHLQDIPALPQLADYAIPESQRAPMYTIISMLRVNYLKPAVVVLTGATPERREQYSKAFLALLKAEHPANVFDTSVTLLGEEDKVKVYGNPDEILGGLFRFIDTVNNPNVSGKNDQMAVITANVNEIGEFILQELLESGVSKTHRQGVKKERILCVLSINDNAKVTPQIISRSHCIIKCE